MDFTAYPKQLRDAVIALAEENASLHLATSITADDCEVYAKDDDVQVAFWAMQMACGDDAESWSDIYQKLTDQERTTVVCALAVGYQKSAHELLRAAVVAHIAEWLACEAEKYQELNLQERAA